MARRRGFTFTEVLIGMLLLAGIVAAVYAYLVHNHRALVRMEDLVKFHGLGAQVIEAAVHADLRELTTKNDAERAAWVAQVLAGSELSGTEIRTALEPVSPVPAAWMITVDVQWADPGSQGRRIAHRSVFHRLLVSQEESLVASLPVK